MLKCGHVYCAECFEEYFRQKIEIENECDNLKCPQRGCHMKPTADEIKAITTQDCFEKFCKY